MDFPCGRFCEADFLSGSRKAGFPSDREADFLRGFCEADFLSGFHDSRNCDFWTIAEDRLFFKLALLYTCYEA